LETNLKNRWVKYILHANKTNAKRKGKNPRNDIQSES
jgi:hypothetical protein